MGKDNTSTVQSVHLSRLVPHPDNPNRMGRQKFAKLVRNIELTGRYEPLIVRPCPHHQHDSYDNSTTCHCEIAEGGRGNLGCSEDRLLRRRAPRNDNGSEQVRVYQIISGHNRARALEKLGCETAEVIVWDVDDHQAGILLATFNRLCGSDVLSTKIALLKCLKKRLNAAELAKLLPQSAGQIERLTCLKLPKRPAPATAMPQPMVVFVSAEQQKAIEQAMSLAPPGPKLRTRAARKAAALTRIAQAFIEHNDTPAAGGNKSTDTTMR
jgi:hypothetical protein